MVEAAGHGDSKAGAENTSQKALQVGRVNSKAAQVINPASVKALHGCIVLAMTASGISDHIVEVKVFRSGKYVNSTLQELMEDRNPDGDQIRGFSMSSKYGDVEASIRVEAREETLAATAASFNPKVPKLFEDGIEAELRNVRAFYSGARESTVEFLRSKIPLVLAIVGAAFLLVIALGGWLLGGSAGGQTTSQLHVQPVVVQPAPVSGVDLSASKRFFLGSLQLLKWVVVWVTCLTLGFGASWVRTHLFPSLIFDIGEGHERYEWIKKWRWFVLVAVGLVAVLNWAARLALDFAIEHLLPH